MGLRTILKKVKQREKEMRLLMVGLDNAGKTTIVKSINGEDITTVSPTLGFSIRTMQYKTFRLNIWDVGGQRTLRAYWRNYFEATDALVWVVDAADTRRLADCAAELHALLKEERLAGATLLVLANKQDLDSALQPARIAQALDLEALGSRHWRIAGCSAVSSKGLLDAFDWVVMDIQSRVFMLN